MQIIVSFFGSYFTEQAIDKSISANKLFWRFFLLVAAMGLVLSFIYGFSWENTLFDLYLALGGSLFMYGLVKLSYLQKKRKADIMPFRK